MLCEVEFLPVGEGSRTGDAILLRYGTPENYELMLVDGGFSATGEMIVEHIKKQFGNKPLSHVVLTHADSDHASGLREVFEKIPVSNFHLHIPWLLAPEAMPLFANKQWQADKLTAKIRGEYSIVDEIISIAHSKGTKFFYPFQGQQIGPFICLSPSRRAYLNLLPQFDRTPDPDQAAIEASGMWIGKAPLPGALGQMLEKVTAKAQTWVDETWAHERLKDGGISSASNESSVVLYGAFDSNRRVLLTGDAGVHALTWSADYADQIGLPLQKFTCVQIPHHGSRRNVGPTILNRILGPVVAQGSSSSFAAMVSAPPDDVTHPRLMVLNAFMRRGGRIVWTKGYERVHTGGFPMRPGYSSGIEYPTFFTKVEDYD